jgi:hypothetical protein
MTNPVDIDLLLDDARLVVEYATRAGRLPDGALPKAIEAAERDRASGAHVDRAGLLSALDAAIRAIAPVTLIDLRDGRSPFDVRGQQAARRLVIFLCILSIVLTGFIAFYTNSLYQADSAITAIHQIETIRYLDKVRAVRRLTLDKELFAKRDARYAHYHQQLGDLAFARAVHNAAAALIVETAHLETFPLADTASSLWNGVMHASAPLPALVQPNEAALAAKDESTSAASSPGGKEHTLGTAADASVDLLEDYTFLVSIGDDNPSILLQPAFGPQQSFAIQQQKILLSGWILPLLYGLLGASVYLMRTLLNDKTPNLAFFPVILRIALGGIAGLAIGWFSIPGANTASISTIPFGLAFLAGFSIDAVFTLLERLTQTISAPARQPPGKQRA